MRPMQRWQGFTLVELLIAIAITGVVMAAAMNVYQKSVQVSDVVASRTELQSELRAAMNQIGRDLNQAGTGIPIGGIPLPSIASGGTNPSFGCDATRCYITTANKFTDGTLYKVTPANDVGVTTSEQTDALVISYIDPLAPANDLTSSATGLDWSGYATTAIAADGSALTMPAGTTPALNDPQKGLVVGDLLLLQNERGSALGAVTGFNAASNNILFASGDAIGINQPAGGVPKPGTIAAIRIEPLPATAPFYKPTSVSRIMMITYFVWKDPNDNHLMLMRQVNSRAAAPIAEYIEDLQITYDVLDNTVNPAVLRADLPDAVIGTPPVQSPNQIRKINLRLTARSPKTDARGLYDRLSITTSIGPRNLGFHDKYN